MNVMDVCTMDETHPTSGTQPERFGWTLKRILAHHPLLSLLGDAEKAQIAMRARPRLLAAGAAIFAKGAPSTSFFAVESGSVRIRSGARSGGEIVYSVIQPGETFGEISMFDERPRSADAVAAEETRIWEIERAAVAASIFVHSSLSRHMCLLLCERLRRCSQQVEDALFLNTASRLAKAILRMAQSNGGIELRVNVTQKQLGDMIGLSRESTNKQLQIWVRNNWISTEKGGLVVRDPGALSQCAEPVGRSA